jgi:hypothetical protein
LGHADRRTRRSVRALAVRRRSRRARSCRLALEADMTGHEAIFIAAADIRFDAPTEDLLRECAPPNSSAGVRYRLRPQ